MTTTEEWRPAVGWSDLYEVSNLGRVRNHKTGHVKAQQTDTKGRRWVALQRGSGKTQTARVSRLVGLAFLPVPTEGQTDVCHNDGDLANNCATNLRWDTHAANMADVVEHGTGRNQNTDKTRCKRDHELNAANTYVAPKTGARACRACRQLHDQKYRQRRKVG